MFGTFLFYEFFLILPFFTLYTYLFITKVLCEAESFISILKHLPLIPSIISLLMRQLCVCSISHEAQTKINDLRGQVVKNLINIPTSDEESRNNLKKMSQIIKTAEPMNGSGFFEVF